MVCKRGAYVSKGTTVGSWLPYAVRGRLDDIAHMEDRPMTDVINDAVELYAKHVGYYVMLSKYGFTDTKYGSRKHERVRGVLSGNKIAVDEYVGQVVKLRYNRDRGKFSLYTKQKGKGWKKALAPKTFELSDVTFKSNNSEVYITGVLVNYAIEPEDFLQLTPEQVQWPEPRYGTWDITGWYVGSRYDGPRPKRLLKAERFVSGEDASTSIEGWYHAIADRVYNATLGEELKSRYDH